MNKTARKGAAFAIAGILLSVPLAIATEIYDYALLPKKLAFFFFLSLASLCWLAEAYRTKAAIPVSGALKALGAFVGLASLSLIGTTNPIVGVSELVFQIALGGILILGLRATESEEDLWLGVTTGVAAVVSGIGVLQYLNLGFMWIPTNGNPSATFGYRNFAAMYLVAAIPFCAVNLLRATRPWQVGLAGIATALSTLFMIYTRTRGAWVGLVGGTAALVVLVAVIPAARKAIIAATSQSKRSKLAAIGATACLLIIAGAIEPQFVGTGLQRFDEKKTDITTTLSSIVTQAGDRGRVKMWKRSLPLIWDHALLGVGPGHWEYAYPKYDHGTMLRPDSSPKRPHNDYLWIAGEHGVPALVAFLCFLALTAITGIRTLRRGVERDVLIVSAAGAAAIGVCLHALFSFPKEQPQAIIFLYLAAGMIMRRSSSRAQGVRALPVAAAVSVVALVGVYVTLQQVTFDRHYLGALVSEDHAEWTDMESASRSALQVGAYRPHALVINGRALEKLGRYGEAETSYRRALRISPNSWHAKNGLGVTLKRQGRNDEAMVAYEGALAIYPRAISVRTNLGALYRAMGNEYKAEEAFREVLSVAPGDEGANNNLGNIFKGRGQQDSAEVYYRKALEVNPDLPQANQNLGDLLIKKKQYAESIPYFLKAREASPNKALVHWSLASAYEASAALELAEESYRKAIDVDPAFPRSYFSLATMLFGLHRWEETIELFETFKSIWKGDPKFTEFADGRIKASRDWIARTEKKPPSG
jgi:Flp pilus assembly protein TadD/O-antigen ligase